MYVFSQKEPWSYDQATHMQNWYIILHLKGNKTATVQWESFIHNHSKASIFKELKSKSRDYFESETDSGVNLHNQNR